MYGLATSFVLGFHGCSHRVAGRLLAGADFAASKNEYDWLGHGIYFWEANPKRGLEFAKEALQRARSRARPAVVGAVIDLGLCLDLTAQADIEQVRDAFEALRSAFVKEGTILPTNADSLLTRNLDCAVINFMHQIRQEQGQPAIDTVRGLFVEGNPIYPNSGFREKTHSQICVCNPSKIKAVFRVPDRYLQ